MSAEKVLENIEQIAPYLALHEEAQLADYGESAAGGPYIKLRMPDPDSLAVFRGKDRATKTKQGTRYIVMMIEVQDDETPVNQQRRQAMEEGMKGGVLSRHAGALCNDANFVRFLNEHHGANVPWDKDTAKMFIYRVCRIRSRRELDHNEEAAQRYKSFVQAPFLDYLRENDLA